MLVFFITLAVGLIIWLLTHWYGDDVKEAHKQRKLKREARKNARSNILSTFERLVTDLKGVWDSSKPKMISPAESSRRIINRFISDYSQDSARLNDSVKVIVNETLERLQNDLDNNNDIDFDYLESQYLRAMKNNRTWGK